jgi:Zn-dependent protease
MSRVARLAGALALLAALTSPARAEDAGAALQPDMPMFAYRAQMNSMVGMHFLNGDYAFLEAAAARFRATKSRTPAGGFELASFYKAFEIEPSDDPAADDRSLVAAEARAANWAVQFPNSPTPRIVYGLLLIQHAWVCRGAGDINSVKPDGMLRFDDELKQASDYLVQYKTIAAVDAHWYVAMLNVALGQSWQPSEYEALLSEALDRFPDYPTLYAQGAMYYLPQWQGSIDALDAYVEDSVSRSRAISGTQEYARIYAAMADTGFARQNIFLTTHANWVRMLNGFLEIAHTYPDQTVWEEIFQFACEAGDRITAHAMLDEHKWISYSPLWRSKEEFQRCQSWTLDATQGLGPTSSPLNISIQKDVSRAMFGVALTNVLPDSFALGFLWYAVFVFSLVFHEAAHAFAARLGGDLTASNRGLATLNPLVHFRREPVGMMIVPIVSFLVFGGMMGWASVPSNRVWAAQHPHRAAWMAISGPAANLFLMLFAAILLRLGLAYGFYVHPQNLGFAEIVVRSASGSGDLVSTILSILFVLNLTLALINLLPVPPFDGSSAIALLMPEDLARRFQTLVRGRYVALAGLAAVFAVATLLIGPSINFALRLLFAGYV